MGMLVRLDGSHEMGRKGVGCVTLATSHTPIIALSKGILGDDLLVNKASLKGGTVHYIPMTNKKTPLSKTRLLS